MSAAENKRFIVEVICLAGLILVLFASVAVILQKTSAARERLTLKGGMVSEHEYAATEIFFQANEAAIRTVEASLIQQGLFSSELRVVAVGSAYPIPYEAETCPFSNISQPAMNQLDRDGDGITDDWELRYGLDKYNAADALTDFDEDGFSNLEEFKANSDPKDPILHPPYAKKLRFIKRKNVPFPLVFQGVMKLSDGSTVFQLNTPADGLTHFLSVGESMEGITLERFIPKSDESLSRLFVMRDGQEIELIRGQVSADPESKAELINILDRSSIIATMGALLSLPSEEYKVLGVYHDKVVICHLESEEVYEIVSGAEGVR